jgi:hypothetical protein
MMISRENITGREEILEISQWLHDKGFEPDMWFDHDKTNGALFVCPEYVKDEFENPSSANLSPWISLTRALELLPNVIRADGFKYEFEMYKTADGFIIWYTSDCGAVNKDFEGESSTSDEVDVELAALRLLKQVVDAGYLKGESDEGS